MSTLSLPYESSVSLDQIVSIKDRSLEEFLKLLSIDRVKRFSEECKVKHIEMKGIQKDIKLPKRVFLSIMQSVFGLAKFLYPIYQIIFSRFKIVKCELTAPSTRHGLFIINKIIPEEEIDIYEVSCALVCFVKCDSQSKLHLLFDLTDIDDDGYINKQEIKKLIYTLNCLFSKEEGVMETNSTIVTQSLASIKSHLVYQMIMNNPGDLSTVILNSIYINFNQFYSAIQKITSKSIDIIPFFVNFKDCLQTKRTEQEIIIKQKNYREYESISNDLISRIKNNNDIIKTASDFKKNLVFKKLSVKQLKTNPTIKVSQKNKLRIQTKDERGYSSKKTRKFYLNRDGALQVDYNTINYLETYPGRITLIENDKGRNTPIKERLPTLSKLNVINQHRHHNQNSQRHYHKSSYMTLDEITSEISLVFNRRRFEEQSTQYLIEVNKKITNKAFETKDFLKDSNPYQNLVIRKYVHKGIKTII